MDLSSRRAVTVFLLLILLAPKSAFAYDVKGQVRVEPPWPARAEIQIPEKHHMGCGTMTQAQSLSVSSDGFVKNVLVSLEGKSPTPVESARAERPVLDQINCRFEPHVLALQKGQKFQIENHDAMAHDVRAFHGSQIQFFFEMDPFGPAVTKVFENAGRYVIRCGLHKWMYALVFAMDHPYFSVTNEAGEFAITEVPAGTYTLKIWHEVLGERIQSIHIKESVENISIFFSSIQST